jgi:hypothetical protein
MMVTDKGASPSVMLALNIVVRKFRSSLSRFLAIDYIQNSHQCKQIVVLLWYKFRIQACVPRFQLDSLTETDSGSVFQHWDRIA